MASKVTNEDILRINELYYKHKTYAEVARQTGFAASTVKKYVISGWTPVAAENIVRFSIEQIPDFQDSVKIFRGIDNYGELCVLSEHEVKQIEELWAEMVI